VGVFIFSPTGRFMGGGAVLSRMTLDEVDIAEVSIRMPCTFSVFYDTFAMLFLRQSRCLGEAKYPRISIVRFSGLIQCKWVLAGSYCYVN
jgi:hypothetical protein